MKIVIYSPTFYPPVVDGTSVQAKRQVDMLSEDNEVYPITFSVDRDLKIIQHPLLDGIERIEPTYINRKKFPDISGELVAKRISDIHPDVIGIRGWYQFKVIKEIFDRNLGSSRILWHVDGIYECHEHFKNDPFYSSFIDSVISADVGIVSHSSEDTKMLLEIGFKKEKIRELPPIINYSKFSQNKDWSKPIILSVGRFFPYKRHEEVFEVAKEVDSSLDIILAGAGDSECSTSIIDRLNKRGAVLLINPSDSLLERIYSLATHFLLASTVESLGIATLESVVAGCIPLVRKIGGIISYLPDDFLFSDREEFANKLREIIKPEVIEKKVRKLSQIKESMSYERVKERFGKVYAGLV